MPYCRYAAPTPIFSSSSIVWHEVSHSSQFLCEVEGYKWVKALVAHRANRATSPFSPLSANVPDSRREMPATLIVRLHFAQLYCSSGLLSSPPTFNFYTFPSETVRYARRTGVHDLSSLPFLGYLHLIGISLRALPFVFRVGLAGPPDSRN